MRRAVLIALALLALLALVPSGSGRGRANAAAYRWYKLSGTFTGRYTETGGSTGGHDLTLSTTWTVRTDPFKLKLEHGRVSFSAGEVKAPRRSTLQSAKLVYVVDQGDECPKSSKTTYEQASEPLYFSWYYDSAEGHLIPHGGFSDFSHGHTERHCSAARPPDYVGPQRVSCADINRDSGYPYGECFVRGADDVWAQTFLGVKDDPVKATRALFSVRVPSGRLGHDFSFRTSLVDSRKDTASGSAREAIHYVYSFKFRACPSHGLTKKGC